MVFLLNNLFNPFPILVCQSISIHTQPTSKVTVQHERVPKSFSKKKGKKKNLLSFSQKLLVPKWSQLYYSSLLYVLKFPRYSHFSCETMLYEYTSIWNPISKPFWSFRGSLIHEPQSHFINRAFNSQTNLFSTLKKASKNSEILTSDNLY